MSREAKYSIQDLKKDFPDDEACLSFIFDTLHSRECSCGGVYRRITGRKQFQCSRCRYQIAPTAGTIFQKSSTPLTMWFHAIWIFSNAKSGISAEEMERQLGVTYKCSYRILSTIRHILIQDTIPLAGSIEIDSGYIGGTKRSLKGKRAQALSQKSIITVAVERGGRIRAKVMPGMGGRYMDTFIKENIAPKAKIMTDGASLYIRHKTKMVNHSKGEYARGKIHINTVESWIGHIKRSISGTYKTISSHRLQSYLDAFVFHYNNRHNDRNRFETLCDVVLHA